MNNAIFYSIFKLSEDPAVESVALFLSHYMTYILIVVILISILYRKHALFLKLFIVGGAGVTAFVISKILKLGSEPPLKIIRLSLRHCNS